jgi:hypothetical protein
MACKELWLLICGKLESEVFVDWQKIHTGRRTIHKATTDGLVQDLKNSLEEVWERTLSQILREDTLNRLTGLHFHIYPDTGRLIAFPEYEDQRWLSDWKTGIELVSSQICNQYVQLAKLEADDIQFDSGYMSLVKEFWQLLESATKNPSLQRTLARLKTIAPDVRFYRCIDDESETREQFYV